MASTAQAKWALGSQFMVEDSPGSGTFTAIAEVTSIDGFGITTDTVDVTPHDSTNGFEQVIPTIHRNNEVTLELNFLVSESLHTQLIADQIARTARNYRVDIANGQGQWDFCGYITSNTKPLPVDDSIRMTTTVKPTGVQTFTAS